MIDLGATVHHGLARHRTRGGGGSPIAEGLRPCCRGAVGEVHRDVLVGLSPAEAGPDQLQVGVGAAGHVDRLALGLRHVAGTLLAADLAVTRRNLTHLEGRSSPRHHDFFRRRIAPGDDVPARRGRVVQVVGVEVVAVAIEALVIGHLPRRGGDPEGVERAVGDVLAERHRDGRRHLQPDENHARIDRQRHALQFLALCDRVGVAIDVVRCLILATRGGVPVRLHRDDALVGVVVRRAPVAERLGPDLARAVGVIQPDLLAGLAAVHRRPGQVQHVDRLIEPLVGGVNLEVELGLRQLDRLPPRVDDVRLVGLLATQPIDGKTGRRAQAKADPVPGQGGRVRARNGIPGIRVAVAVHAAVGERRSVADHSDAQALGRENRRAVGCQPQLAAGGLAVGVAAGAEVVGAADGVVGRAAVGLESGERGGSAAGRHARGRVSRIRRRGVGNHRRPLRRGRRLPGQRRRVAGGAADERGRRKSRRRPGRGRQEQRPAELCVLSENSLRSPGRKAGLGVLRHRRGERIDLAEGLNPRDGPHQNRIARHVQKTVAGGPHLRDERRRPLRLPVVGIANGADAWVRLVAELEVFVDHDVEFIDEQSEHDERPGDEFQFQHRPARADPAAPKICGIDVGEECGPLAPQRSPAAHVNRPVRPHGQALRPAGVLHEELAGAEPGGWNVQGVGDLQEIEAAGAAPPVLGLIGVGVVLDLDDLSAATLPHL